MNVSKRGRANFRRGVRRSVFEEERGSVCVCVHMFCEEDVKIFED